MNILHNINTALLLGAMTMGSLSAMGAEGVEIDHLGTNNTLVRVTGDGRYLMLPVQESNDDARINIVVDGKIAETIFVRLAKSKCDYSVPFDLAPYKGKNVILDVVTPHGRSTTREAKEDACWQEITLTDTVDNTDRETKYRPQFHHTPPLRMDERPQRYVLQRWCMEPLLPIQPLRLEMAEHDLGPLHIDRPRQLET